LILSGTHSALWTHLLVVEISLTRPRR